MLENTKNLENATGRRIFFETEVGEELLILEDYKEREKVVGWEWSMIYGVAAFVLYVA